MCRRNYEKATVATEMQALAEIGLSDCTMLINHIKYFGLPSRGSDKPLKDF